MTLPWVGAIIPVRLNWSVLLHTRFITLYRAQWVALGPVAVALLDLYLDIDPDVFSLYAGSIVRSFARWLNARHHVCRT